MKANNDFVILDFPHFKEKTAYRARALSCAVF